jgi:hypothetical protein
MIFPPREDQHGGMALEGSREDLRALHTKANAVVLIGQWVTSIYGKLGVAKRLKLYAAAITHGLDKTPGLKSMTGAGFREALQ